MGATPRTGLVRFPLLGELSPGTIQRHEVSLPGSQLVQERWSVVTVTGVTDGPTLFVSAGVHGGEYPAIEAAIRLPRSLDPSHLAGTVVIMPVVNLPAFWSRSMFVCPVDGLNPNRTFPGDPEGSYTEQLVYALTTEFISHSDAYIDLHGGDIVEDLVPFSICRSGKEDIEQRALELASAFGLPYLLIVDKPVQQAKGSMSYVAAAELGVPAFIAEAGGVGQLQDDAVELLLNGLHRVLTYLGMFDGSTEKASAPIVLKSFEWLYCQNGGMFYSNISVGDDVEGGQIIGRVGSLFGDTLEEIVSPVSGKVLFLTSNPAVKSNGLLMGIGVE